MGIALPLFSSHKIGGSAHGGTSLAVRTRMPWPQIADPLYRVGASAAWMVPRRPGDPTGGLPTCISPIAPALRELKRPNDFMSGSKRSALGSCLSGTLEAVVFTAPSSPIHLRRVECWRFTKDL